MPVVLSERQQTTVGIAVTILAAAVIATAVLGVMWLLVLFFRTFSGVFLPLAVAAVAALVAKPYYEAIRRVLRVPPVVALVLVLLSAAVPLAAFLWFFGALLVDQASELLSQVPEWWKGLVKLVETHWPQVMKFVQENPLLRRLGSAVQGQEQSVVAGLQVVGSKALVAGFGVVRFVTGLLGWVVLPVYFSFFLIAEPKAVQGIESWLPFLKPETRKDVAYLAREFVAIVVTFFRGQLIVAFLQGLLFAIGFTLVGLRFGFILGLVLGFANIIPYLGSIVGLAVCLPLGFFQGGGGIGLVIWVLVVFTAVQTIEAYVLTPRVMGQRTGLHPMVIIVSVFFWGTALHGLLGMVLAIPLTAFLVVLLRLAQEKYVKELV